MSVPKERLQCREDKRAHCIPGKINEDKNKYNYLTYISFLNYRFSSREYVFPIKKLKSSWV